MPDIFISYSSMDRKWVKKFVKGLEEYNLDVWWDPHIKPGQAYREVIQEALDDSDCVIVVWSIASVKSIWVQAEATQALQRGILIPVVHDESRIPMPFNGIQTADLKSWNGNTSDRNFYGVISGIRRHCLNVDSALPKAESKEKVIKKSKQEQSNDKVFEENKITAVKNAAEITKTNAKRYAQQHADIDENTIRNHPQTQKRNISQTTRKNEHPNIVHSQVKSKNKKNPEIKEVSNGTSLWKEPKQNKVNKSYTMFDYREELKKIRESNTTAYECSNCKFPVKYSGSSALGGLVFLIIFILVFVISFTFFDSWWAIILSVIVVGFIGLIVFGFISDYEIMNEPQSCPSCETSLTKPLKVIKIG